MSDLLDILTLAEAKRAINLDSAVTTHDTEIALWVTTISRRIDDLYGPVVARTVTDTFYGPGGHLALSATPVLIITSVTEYRSGASTVLTAEDHDTVGTYLLDEARIYRRSGWTPWAWQGGTVVVVYSAGRYADTASVDAKYKGPASLVLQSMWQKYAGRWATAGDPFAVDEPVLFNELDPILNRWLGRQTQVIG